MKDEETIPLQAQAMGTTIYFENYIKGAQFVFHQFPKVNNRFQKGLFCFFIYGNQSKHKRNIKVTSTRWIGPIDFFGKLELTLNTTPNSTKETSSPYLFNRV